MKKSFMFGSVPVLTALVISVFVAQNAFADDGVTTVGGVAVGVGAGVTSTTTSTVNNQSAGGAITGQGSGGVAYAHPYYDQKFPVVMAGMQGSGSAVIDPKGNFSGQADTSVFASGLWAFGAQIQYEQSGNAAFSEQLLRFGWSPMAGVYPLGEKKYIYVAPLFGGALDANVSRNPKGSNLAEGKGLDLSFGLKAGIRFPKFLVNASVSADGLGGDVTALSRLGFNVDATIPVSAISDTFGIGGKLSTIRYDNDDAHASDRMSATQATITLSGAW